MKDLLEQFIKIERKVSEEMGAFNLFALFLREDEQYLWDVVVAAPWIELDQKFALQYLGKKLQQELTTDELMQLSHIAIIDYDNPGLPAVTQTVNIEHGLVELRDQVFFGHAIKRAYFITSQSLIAKELRPAA